MKALLIKVLPATNTMANRYKVIVEGQKALILQCDDNRFDFEYNCKPMLEQLAQLAVEHFGFNHLGHNVGQLPSGDHCITLFNKDI
tara:strand:+ start:302 stop:559 length:258 start_codon:yes stop_codon:yes gene_type:complete